MPNAPKKLIPRPKPKPAKPRPTAKIVRHKVRELRTERNLSQEKLAEMIGKTRGLIAQYERGSTDIPLEVVYDLADAFGVTPGAVIGDGSFTLTVSEIAKTLNGTPETIQRDALGYVRGITTSKR